MDSFEQEQVDKQTDRFTKEIFELKQRIGELECYIGFRDLWNDFNELTKQRKTFVEEVTSHMIEEEVDCPIHGKLGGINECPRC